MEHAPYERLKWRVLRYAGALPSEKRAQEMTDADYLYCLVHEMLDREEAMERLCPECRTRAEEARCSICGELLADAAGQLPGQDGVGTQGVVGAVLLIAAHRDDD